MNTQELLQQLRAKDWEDRDIANVLGMDPSSIYRWRMGITSPQSERLVIAALQRLLRRRGPPRRKDVAGISPATCVASANRHGQREALLV
jgi:hypothetical protein